MTYGKASSPYRPAFFSIAALIAACASITILGHSKTGISLRANGLVQLDSVIHIHTRSWARALLVIFSPGRSRRNHQLEEQDARFVMEPIPRVEARGQRAARAIGASTARTKRTEEVRNTNGVWNDGGRPRYTRVSAVLSADRLTAWRLAEVRSRLILNPDARHPLAKSLPRVGQSQISFLAHCYRIAWRGLAARGTPRTARGSSWNTPESHFGTFGGLGPPGGRTQV
jgi:hypothetical protein